VTDDCKTGRDWRASVQDAIARTYDGPPMAGALEVSLTFTMPRPQAHFTKRGELRPSAPACPTTRPDRSKLTRAVEDAATGLLWRDDAQIVAGSITKRYGERIGVVIHCQALETGGKNQCYGGNSTTTRSSSPRASRNSSTCE
jgi:Holliday junction resolvase RusA-like endonuclease